MRLLLKAARYNRRAIILLCTSFLTLIVLTIANSLEISALGVLTNVESLTMITSGKGQVVVPLAPTTNHQLTSNFIERHKETNPLNWALHQAKDSFPDLDSLHVLIAILLCIAVFKAASLFSSRYMTQLLAIRLSKELRQRYFEHIQSLPMSFYQKHNIGSLSSRVVGDASQIATSINSALTNFLHTPFTIAVTLVFCFYISWQLSIVIFLGIPMIIIPIIFLAKRVKRVSRQLQINQEKFTSVLIDFLAGIQTVKIFVMEPFSLKKYREQNDRMAVLESKNAKYGLMTRPVLHAITTLCLATVVLFGLYSIKMTISELIVFCGLLQMTYESVKKFADENASIQRGVVAAERMFDVLDIKPEIKDRKGAIELGDFQDKIQFDKVWFRYGEEWVLKDLSFTVNKGETVAIVGATGAGKSTIVQLIPRLYEVQRGTIRIDGKSLDSYTQRSLREAIAYVSQRPFLFCDTVAGNIAYGRQYSREEIEIAAKRAYADEFITNLPRGYDTMLAEAGQNLSGGQQQRLAIARAFVKKARILILDEATSSLDALSENRIRDAVSNVHGEITQIIIAHRLGTIEHADRIIYLEKGEKIGEGTKKHLLETCEPFRLTWEALYHIERKEKREAVLVK